MWGASLFEGDPAAFANEGTLERRLKDARAFGIACNGLADRTPELSARTGLTPGQRHGAQALLGAALVFLVLRPQAFEAAVIALFAIVFGLIVLLRLMATIAAFIPSTLKPLPRIADADLPPLTALVPLYREAEVASALIQSIQKLDYPVDRLDVKLLIEADDEPTLRAVLAAGPPSWFEIIPVPPGAPRTKPKALNYGLASARGDYIAVFDAEDRPAPDQPREAISAFRSGPSNLAVVQAPLLVHNGADSWIARQFDVEYAIHFRVWLPFLARLRVPLALGGTSNYFRRDRLEAAGAWDAWNVTEDADLGLRLARFGGAATTISAPTWEEGPSRLKDWMSQRTRWMKGHLQTWVVASRQPVAAAKGMGWLNYLSVQLTLGGSLLASMMHAPLMIWMLLGLLTPYSSLEGWHAAVFGVGYGGVLAAAIAARMKQTPVMALATLPLYWPLLSLAMISALWEIRRRPHFWAKTPHGRSTARQAAGRTARSPGHREGASRGS